MKVDVSVNGDLAGMPLTAQGLEADGWDGIWASEVNHEPFLPLALAAANTERVDLGTAIAVAFSRNPMTTAQVVWDLQRLSNGRMHLGLGSQIKPHIERRFSMPWSRPAARMREYVLALRAIWGAWQDGTPLDFQGEFYTHNLMTPTFDPGPLPSGLPPVFVAAVGRKMAAVAGEVADGLLVHSFTTPLYLTEIMEPAIASRLGVSGRSRSDFTTRYSPFIVSGVDEQSMENSARTARERIAFYGSTPAYRPVLEVHGWGDLQPELQQLSRLGEWTKMGTLIDDEILDAFAVVASPEMLPAAFAARVKGLTDRIAVPLDGLSHETALAVREALTAL